MFFSSQTLFMLHHKVWSSQIRTTLCTRSPRFVIDLNFQNFFVCFGLTNSSISVIPRSLSRSRFSISVQPIWTFRSHRVAVTACSYASRCHRVVPLGHTDRVRIYIPTGWILEISPKPFIPRVSCSTASGLRIVSSLLATSRRWFPSLSTGFCPAVVAVANSRRTRVWVRSFVLIPYSDS